MNLSATAAAAKRLLKTRFAMKRGYEYIKLVMLIGATLLIIAVFVVLNNIRKSLT